MNVIESIELPDVLGLIVKPRYILGTTYTLSLAFFESAVFPNFKRDQLKSCLIICDALGYHNALTEAPALQGAAQDYLVVPAPVSGSFHAKVWIVVGDGEFLLLTGSGNLTQAGFIDNAELFDALHIKADAPPSSALLADIRSFVKGLAGMWSSDNHQHLLCVDTLNQIDQALGGISGSPKDVPESPRFLHSFQGRLVEQLPATTDAKELYIAAPYFGDSLQGLDLIAINYPSARVNLFPAVHSGSATDIPLEQLRKARKNARIAALKIPSKKKAFAHLKLFGVSAAADNSWSFCGSANCTLAAWEGPNVEAGLLRRVSPALLKELFSPSEQALPNGRRPKLNAHDFSDLLQCWATDTSEGLDLQMAGGDQSKFPLQEVCIRVRAGSHLAICEKKILFQSSKHVHLPWTSFDGWQRWRKVALCVELDAKDAKGRKVRAHCLVENRLLLSADPTHRSAWRGAQALLDAEGAPEMGDIAAIFSMARDVFGGKLLTVPMVKPADAGSGQKAKEVEFVGIAAWPPQPDTHELQRRLHSTALGQLKWFQHILKAFLKNPAIGETAHDHRHAYGSQPADEHEDYQKKKETDFGKMEERAIKQAERIWEEAHTDYQQLREKLFVLCPNSKNAMNIWPASIFAFLSTMAVFHSAKRKAADLPAKTGLDEGVLCDEFFRVMFNHRQQHDDFCCPKGFRYREERFRPLADDLFITFKIKLHSDLASVIIALAIDRQLRQESPILKKYPPLTNNQLDMACDESFKPDGEMRDACRRIWHRYLRGQSRKDSDAAFDQQFNNLFNLNIETAI